MKFEMKIEIVEVVDFLFWLKLKNWIWKCENLVKICYIELFGDVSCSDTVTSWPCFVRRRCWIIFNIVGRKGRVVTSSFLAIFYSSGCLFEQAVTKTLISVFSLVLFHTSYPFFFVSCALVILFSVILNIRSYKHSATWQFWSTDACISSVFEPLFLTLQRDPCIRKAYLLKWCLYSVSLMLDNVNHNV